MMSMEGWGCTITTKFNGFSLIGNVIQESRMRENLTYGLMRVQGKQNSYITAPLSYSTNESLKSFFLKQMNDNNVIKNFHCSVIYKNNEIFDI